MTVERSTPQRSATSRCEASRASDAGGSLKFDAMANSEAPTLHVPGAIKAGLTVERRPSILRIYKGAYVYT
jgi:hypothetical protein